MVPRSAGRHLQTGDVYKRQDKNYIQKYDIEIEGRPTSTEWTGKESIEEYIEKAEYTVVLKIHLQDGKAESEYAEEISDLMQEIMQCDLNIHILVYVNGENRCV